MKFFVDTADVAEIKDLAASGLLDGVTVAADIGLKAFLDDWAKTGQSIL
jgi:transaldolase